MTEAQKKEYGIKLREIRLAMGLTMREVALGMELDVSILSKIERGNIPLPKIEPMLDIDINVTCHRCDLIFKAHPLMCEGHLIPFPAYVCKECREAPNEEGS